MRRPRALVVRSGANPFLQLAPSTSIEIVEKVSHSIRAIEPDERELESPAGYAIFTSQVAVERLFANAKLSALFARAIEGGRVIAIGPVTAEALEGKGVKPDLVAAGAGDRVLEILPKDLHGARVLLPRGEDASAEIPEGLRSRGAHPVALVLYRKEPNPPDPKLAREIVENPFAAFCATSPSAANWLFAGLPAKAAEILQRTPAVVLGRFTRRYLESHGVARVEVTEEARFAEAVALLEALAGAPART